MSNTVSFLIRDGLESDVEACLALDHQYETDFVWQMNVVEEVGQWSATFKTERLPRPMEAIVPSNKQRIELAISSRQCFLVAVGGQEQEVLGYLTMRNDPVYRAALIQDLTVSRPYRRRRIGTRLLKAVRQWAREHDLLRLTAEIQTKNYPGISFCRQMGFTFSGYNDQYFPNQDIAIFFSQSLR